MGLGTAGAGGPALSTGIVVWRQQGALRATIVAKATFDIAHDTTMRLRAPAELAVQDRQLDGNPAASVQAASDLMPFRARADVTFVGHAVAPASQTVAGVLVRLAMYRDGMILERVLHVYCDRDPAGNVLPFARMPLTPERAMAHVENPVGSPRPNVVDARGPSIPGFFGPVSRFWPSRARCLRGANAPASIGIVELPTDFDWGFYQVAPFDQQVSFLRGDEWVVLDGIHPKIPRIKSQLPSTSARALVYLANGDRLGPGRVLQLVADGLVIDGDALTCAVTFRGSFAVESEAQLALLKVVVGLDLGGAGIRWPLVETLALPIAPHARSPAALTPPAPAAKGSLVDTQTLVNGLPRLAPSFGPRPSSPGFGPVPLPGRSFASVDTPSGQQASGLPFTQVAAPNPFANADDLDGTFVLTAEESEGLAGAPPQGLPTSFNVLKLGIDDDDAEGGGTSLLSRGEASGAATTGASDAVPFASRARRDPGST